VQHIYVIAEDDQDTQILIKRAFKQADLSAPLYFTNDGQHTIDYLAGGGEYEDRAKFPMPAILLLDLKMPFRDGFDVLRWIRAQPRLRKLVVIMFSGSSLESDVEEAFNLGVNSFVMKPVSFSELLQVVMAIHHYWFGCNHFPQPDDGANIPRETRFVVAPRERSAGSPETESPAATSVSGSDPVLAGL
jgi:CheY-like chemotaxis protein